MGTLYIVATPIGNLQDISLRATRTLLTVDVIACEDTRRTGLLLQEITKQLTGYSENPKPQLLSYYDQVELQRIPQIIELLKVGKSIALVSDAGTPAISDPGFKLIREVIREGVKVEVIPGPSSVVTALVASGLPTDRFFFVGYPPKKEGHRADFWNEIKDAGKTLRMTVIFFEAPHRIEGTLEELGVLFGKDFELVLCRELTKIHEEILRDNVENLKKHFKTHPPKGEFVGLFHLPIEA